MGFRLIPRTNPRRPATSNRDVFRTKEAQTIESTYHNDSSATYLFIPPNGGENPELGIPDYTGEPEGVASSQGASIGLGFGTLSFPKIMVAAVMVRSTLSWPRPHPRDLDSVTFSLEFNQPPKYVLRTVGTNLRP